MWDGKDAMSWVARLLATFLAPVLLHQDVSNPTPSKLCHYPRTRVYSGLQ